MAAETKQPDKIAIMMSKKQRGGESIWLGQITRRLVTLSAQGPLVFALSPAASRGKIQTKSSAAN